MDFLRKLTSFWFLLLLVGGVGYFGAHNLEKIYVTIPQVGEFKTVAAIAFLSCFLAGAFVAVVFFGWDSVKKSITIRKLNKRIGNIERNRPIPSQPPAQEPARASHPAEPKESLPVIENQS